MHGRLGRFNSSGPGGTKDRYKLFCTQLSPLNDFMISLVGNTAERNPSLSVFGLSKGVETYCASSTPGLVTARRQHMPQHRRLGDRRIASRVNRTDSAAIRSRLRSFSLAKARRLYATDAAICNIISGSVSCRTGRRSVPRCRIRAAMVCRTGWDTQAATELLISTALMSTLKKTLPRAAAPSTSYCSARTARLTKNDTANSIIRSVLPSTPFLELRLHHGWRCRISWAITPNWPKKFPQHVRFTTTG